MSYPFAKGENWGGIIQILLRLGVTLEVEEIRYPNGSKFVVRYLQHIDTDGHRCVFTLDPKQDYGEIVLPTTLLEICDGLRLSPRIFGLDLEGD